MDDDWDLHAVVRSCSSTAAAATAAVVDGNSCGQNLTNLEQDCSFSETDWAQDLHDLLKPFLPKQSVSPQKNLPISPLSVLGGLQDPSSDPQGIKQFPQQKQQLFSVVNGSKPSARSKKRKNHQKKVCHVAAESLSSDLWSWRKYGQKPIKGSPYPRGYYRCSTSKGCMARKQVERNRSDPGMFIVTYTGEHNHPVPKHRNSLAGSTRHKSAEGPAPDDSKKSPGAGQLSPALEKLESSPEDPADMDDDEDDEEFGASKMALDDDFFAGLEDFEGDYLSDDFPTNLGVHWLGSNGTTAAAAEGGGGGGGGC